MFKRSATRQWGQWILGSGLVLGTSVGITAALWSKYGDQWLRDGLEIGTEAIGCPIKADQVKVHFWEHKSIQIKGLTIPNPDYTDTPPIPPNATASPSAPVVTGNPATRTWGSDSFLTVKEVSTEYKLLEKEGLVVMEEIILDDVTLNLERSFFGNETNYGKLLKRMDEALNTLPPSETTAEELPPVDVTDGMGLGGVRKSPDTPLFIHKTVLRNVKVRVGLLPELNPFKNMFVTVVIPRLEVTEDFSKDQLETRRSGRLLFDVIKGVVLSCLFTVQDVLPASELKQIGSLGVESVANIGTAVKGVTEVAALSTVQILKSNAQGLSMIIKGAGSGLDIATKGLVRGVWQVAKGKPLEGIKTASTGVTKGVQKAVSQGVQGAEKAAKGTLGGVKDTSETTVQLLLNSAVLKSAAILSILMAAIFIVMSVVSNKKKK
jgi:hypothetical protein